MRGSARRSKVMIRITTMILIMTMMMVMIMMMMMVVMVTERKCKDIQGDDKDNYYDIENDDDQLVN